MSYFDGLMKKRRTRAGAAMAGRGCEAILARLGRFGPVRSVVEIGPGRGDFGFLCKARGIEYTAIEANEGICRSLGAAGLEVVRAQVPPFPADLAGAGADAVVAMHVLEHMSGLGQAVEFIEGMKALVRPGGLILVVSPDIRYSKEWFWAVNYSHNYVTSVSRICQLLDERGLSVEHATNYCGCFFYPWTHLAWYLSRLLPYRLIERLAGRNYVGKSVWTNARITFTPQAFVVARRKL